ncbi:MAG: hypothetical protein LBT00_13510 [Spirochaetaceae bacterium]|jgi:hypothetical protein|nr:hypothetical protein [Spirochaetaceae bacterium]
MIGFLIKKTFFDGWDNLFRIALINIGFIASAAIPVFLPSLLGGVPVLSVIVLAVGILWCFVYLAAASSSLRTLSDNQSFGFGDFFANLKTAWPAGLVMGAIVFAGVLIVTIALPFYLGIKSPAGILFAALIFWLTVIVTLALQFFFAIHFRLGDRIPKALKKCFIIFFDNPGLCLFAFLHNIIIGAISLLLAFLAPGPASILLFLDEAFRLRLLKYDYLEANPDANRKQIPWDALLIDERERTGTRTLRNFIFPWKD